MSGRRASGNTGRSTGGSNGKKSGGETKKGMSLWGILLTLVLIVVLGYLAYTIIKQEITLASQEKQIQQLQSDNELLEEEYQKKLSGIDDGSTLEYVDKYMRSHFGMIQENETRIVVIEAD